MTSEETRPRGYRWCDAEPQPEPDPAKVEWLALLLTAVLLRNKGGAA